MIMNRAQASFEYGGGGPGRTHKKGGRRYPPPSKGVPPKKLDRAAINPFAFLPPRAVDHQRSCLIDMAHSVSQISRIEAFPTIRGEACKYWSWRGKKNNPAYPQKKSAPGSVKWNECVRANAFSPQNNKLSQFQENWKYMISANPHSDEATHSGGIERWVGGAHPWVMRGRGGTADWATWNGAVIGAFLDKPRGVGGGGGAGGIPDQPPPSAQGYETHSTSFVRRRFAGGVPDPGDQNPGFSIPLASWERGIGRLGQRGQGALSLPLGLIRSGLRRSRPRERRRLRCVLRSGAVGAHRLVDHHGAVAGGRNHAVAQLKKIRRVGCVFV